jgi:regulator of sigma E protease
MDYITHALGYVVPFLVVLTILVFVHEYGHFWVARKCGVKIDSFSIGFGREIFGWFDKHGVRWKFSMIPLGGYVKMFGDENETSWTDEADTTGMTDEEKKQLFANKPLRSRVAIVLAGPMFNFAFTLVVFTLLFATIGERFTTPDVGEVVPGSAAEAAGIKPGDVFVSIDGRHIKRFEEVQEMVMLHPSDSMQIVLSHDGVERTINITPSTVDETDRFGNVQHIGRLGVKHTGESAQIIRQSPGMAVVESCRETWSLIDGTMVAIWQMIDGTRPADEMGGVLSIAKISGDSAHSGIVSLVYFMAVLSVNLGLINLFPIPVLDGGHLLFYAIEAVRGKPPGEAVMKYSFRFGLALVLTLAVFANWNDLVHMGFVDFVKGHIS